MYAKLTLTKEALAVLDAEFALSSAYCEATSEAKEYKVYEVPLKSTIRIDQEPPITLDISSSEPIIEKSKDGKEPPIETFTIDQTQRRASFSNWNEFKTDARKRTFNKETGEYDRVMVDVETNEPIYSTKSLEDMGYQIDKLKIQKTRRARAMRSQTKPSVTWNTLGFVWRAKYIKKTKRNKKKSKL